MAKYQEWLEEQNLKKVEYWAMCGLTDEQIAEKMGIRRETLYDWKKKFSNISNTIKKGRSTPVEIAEALKNACVGYYIYEEEIIQDYNGNIRKKKIKKYVKPDTTAIIYALNNLAPDNFSNKHREVADTSQLAKLDEILNEIKADATRGANNNAVHD